MPIVQPITQQPDTLAAPAALAARPAFVAPRAERAAGPVWQPLRLDSLEAQAAASAPAEAPQLPLLRLEVPPRLGRDGFGGDPLPARLRTDDVVTGVLLACCLFAAWVLPLLRRSLRQSLKDAFQPARRSQAPTEVTSAERHGRRALVVAACLLGGIFLYGYAQTARPDLAEADPHWLLALGATGCAAVYVVKATLFALVNHTLFGPVAARQWAEAYRLQVIMAGLLLLPVALVRVFSDVPTGPLLWVVVAIVAGVKLPLYVRCFRIFFGGVAGLVHIILYLCALEIAPLAVAWRCVLRAADYLT